MCPRPFPHLPSSPSRTVHPLPSQVYFPVPDLCTWLSEKSKQKLEWEVDRSTPQKRIEDFVNRSEGMIHEMRHNERISHIPAFHFLSQASNVVHLPPPFIPFHPLLTPPIPFHLIPQASGVVHYSMFVLSWGINFLILLFTYPEVCENAFHGPPSPSHTFHPLLSPFNRRSARTPPASRAKTATGKCASSR